MSENEDIISSLLTESQISVLESNPSVIAEKSDIIMSAMDTSLQEERGNNSVEHLGDQLNLIFASDIPKDDQRNDLINAFMTIAVNFNPEIDKSLSDTISDESLKAFSDLHIKHGKELIRQANRDRKGRRWWSSISTEVLANGDRTNLQHEVTIDQSETVLFSSNLRGSHVLSRHLLRESKLAKNLLGFDILSEMDKQVLIDIKDIAEDLIEDIENYDEGDLDSIEDEPSDMSSNVETLDGGEFDTEKF